MHIDFKCSGGFANLRLRYHADTDNLPKELSEELIMLVESSGIFNIQQNEIAQTGTGPPDVFFYHLSISDGSRRLSLTFNDVTAPESIHPLLSRLRKLALQ